MRTFRRNARPFLCIILGAGAWAQGISTSEIKGAIHDPTGAAVPNAQIKVTQTATGAVRTVISGADGSYALPELSVGPYVIEITKPGFAIYVRTGTVLQVASTPTLDVTLTVGSLSEQVNVEANTAMVETRTGGVGQVIDSRRVVDLPLIGRNVTDLITLSGAATLSTNPQLNSSRNYPTPAITVAGGLGSGTAYVLDGAMHNDPSNGLTLPLPFPDAMQEFKVETGALPAQYGVHSAAAVNALTRSGTNDLHGDVFEFVRNYRFNARNFFAVQRDSLKRNQFGGTLGGPIRKNKLFLFGGYQDTISRQNGITNTMFIPTPAAIDGDFTALASASCNGGVARTLRTPFIENRVSPTLLSGPAINLVAKLPATTDPCGRITFGVANISDDRQAVARADYRPTAKHSVFARYLAANFVSPDPYSLAPNVLQTGAASGASYGQDILAQSAALGETYLLSPNTINSFRATFNRSSVQRVGSSFFSGPDLGVNMHTFFPKYVNIVATGFFTVGTNTSSDARYHTNTYQLGDDLSFIRGRHQLAYGVSAARWGSESLAGVFGSGIFTFSGGAMGNGLADLMLGNAASFQQGAPAGLFMREYYLGLYAQDSWKAGRGLTLSYGVRWEPYLPPQINDGHIGHIDPNAFLEGRHTTVYKNAPNGIFYPGDPGFPSRAGVHSHLSQFAPRVAVAWDPKGDGRTSIRASYGIFYDLLPAQTHLNTIAANPWVGRTTVTGVNFANPWQNQPGGDPFPLPPFSPDSAFGPGGTFVTWDYNMRPTYVQSRNLTVERQIGENWLVSASYLGNQSTHLVSPQALNPAVFLGNTPACTLNGITISACNTTASTAQRRRFSLLNPSQGQYFGDVTYEDFGGTGNYNGLLVSVERRVHRGVTINANYTWSHCISDYVFDSVPTAGQDYTKPDNRHFDRGNCNSSGVDRRQILNVSTIVETPRFSGLWLGMLASRWRVSTIITGQTGSWLNVTTGSVDSALSGIANQRANQIASDIHGAGFSHYLSPSAFALPAIGTAGNLGAGSVEGPGFVAVNMSLSRAFSIRERGRLEFRAEASNILNTVNFGNPNTSVGTSAFGQITTTAGGAGSGFVAPGDPRIMQFAVKYI
ncbi:MAG: carboxypeptidase regulatory-like domain-containing protein, partial [Acidobacteriia bacterium]|nr:carboxypeptidase regulatory-like domain-containing protein [Terriglobia bacterium]